MAKRQSTDRILAQARQAIEHNEPDKARVLLEAAARQDAGDARPWLLLAGIAASPRERHAFLAQADRLKSTPVRASAATSTAPAVLAYPAPLGSSTATGNWVARAGLIFVLLMALAAAGYFMSQSSVGEALVQDAAESIVPVIAESAEIAAIPDANHSSTEGLPTPTLSVSLAAGSVDAFVPLAASPTSEPTEASPLLPPKEVASGADPLATWTVTALPTPTLAPTVTPSPTPEPTATPVPPPPGSPRPYGVGETEKWIDVNLTTQTLTAYEGDTLVLTTLISSGAWQYQTVTGEFRTYLKYETQLMNGYLLGYDYYTPDVPSVMYFFEDFAIHGAYWHNNFGTPVSHGCINANPADAAWLFNWAPLGTFVTVHY